MTARSVIALAAALGASACGARLMKLPSAPAAPAPDAPNALAEALGRCENLRTLTGEIAVSGTAGGHRIRGRLTAGLAAPASARLEAPAPFGQPIFIFVATGDDATLWLPRDQRVLEHARPDVVLDAVAGIPLGVGDLRAIVTGCPSGAPSAPDAQARGDAWRLVPVAGGGELYLHRAKAAEPWRLAVQIGVARDGRRWRADYRDSQRDVPRSIHVTSIGSSTFDLQLTLSQVNINVALPADVFHVNIPESARAITVEELRESGPLAGRTGASHAR